MEYIAASTTHLIFLWILLLSLKSSNLAIELCPTLCRCTLEILNCSRTTNSPHLYRVPNPEPFGHEYNFVMLDFTENAISSIDKWAWWAYPLTENLILKNNRLSRLDNISLDGLFFLVHLNLSGNCILRIMEGTFQTWHGMLFLSKVILSHNPLREIEDSHFYRLPSMEFLDLSSTEITQDILQNLLKISLKTLKTIVLPRKMSYYHHKILSSIEVLHKTAKLDCTNNCLLNIIEYEEEELWATTQDKIMKELETRKLIALLRKLILDEFVNKKRAVENLMKNLDTLDKLLQEAHKTVGSEEEAQELVAKIEKLRTLISGSPTDNSKTFNEVLPDKTLSHETHSEHQEQTTSAPPSVNFLPHSDDCVLFEAMLNKLLAFLIPDELTKNLIFRIICNSFYFYLCYVIFIKVIGNPFG
ncbi:leucine-rich repeat-containing protein 37B-like isoform X2 [Pantherophis guttatus]|uniref:Leucine-rich repeat-containing protein 37B-like isoform X2 n=1 Tax=Pantherophis guttatus TaxID=94885 RepID=A0A6P9BXA7_PANGU|nr:leucine-rich repeat-containing protein 37B-like isoform X2 [Pantherophis guttatus]